jgi:hypothetical protein
MSLSGRPRDGTAESTSSDWSWNPVAGCKAVSTGCIVTLLIAARHWQHPLYKSTSTGTRQARLQRNADIPAAHPTWSWPLQWCGVEALLGPGQPSLVLSSIWRICFTKNVYFD